MPRVLGTSDLRFSSDELRSIMAIAEYGNVTAAAEFLNVSQSALSRVMARVEEVVGVRLFDRTTRRLEITHAGQDFVAIAERMLADFQRAVQTARDADREHHDRITLSTFPVIIRDTLPGLVRDFRLRYPKVTFDIRWGGSEDVVNGVSDYAITGGTIPDVLVSVLLREEPLVVILPGSHPLSKAKKPIRLQELSDSPLIEVSVRTVVRDLLDAATVAARVEFHVPVRVPQVPDVISYVRAGLGFGVVPIGAVPPPHPGLVVRALAGPIRSVRVFLVQLRERPLSPIAAAFRESVIEHYRTLTAPGQPRRI